MLRVTFLGTASSRPTVRRNVPSLAVQREGETYLFDCGEGTQRQMMRFGVGFSTADVFITHLHADHYLGLIGLVRTMSLQGRREPLRVWGPPGGRRTLSDAVDLGGDRLLFDVEIEELAPGEAVRRAEHRIEAYSTRHTARSIGLALVEDDRLGRFDPEAARKLGVPEGPLYGRLHRGEEVELPDGTVVEPDEVVGPARPGRTVVYTGDTRPCRATVEAAEGADLLIHEATFGDPETERAGDTGHSTARQAARVAEEAGVRRLALTHFSARYSEQAHRLGSQASDVFPDPLVPEDGTTVEVPYPDGEGDAGSRRTATGAGRT
jgi:ribonuclease Z